MRFFFILLFLLLSCSKGNTSRQDLKNNIEIGFELSEKDKRTFELEGIKPAFIGLRVERNGETPQVLSIKPGEDVEIEVLTGKNIFKAAIVLYREADGSKLYYSKATQEVDVGKSTEVLNFEFPQLIESAKTNVYGVAYLNDSIPASQFDLQVLEPHTGASITLPDFAHLAKTDVRGVFAFQYFFDRPEIPNVQLKFVSNSKTYNVVRSFTATQQGFSSLGFINLEGAATASPFLISPDLLRGEPGTKGDKGDVGTPGAPGRFVIRAGSLTGTIIGTIFGKMLGGFMAHSDDLNGMGEAFFPVGMDSSGSISVSKINDNLLFTTTDCSSTGYLSAQEELYLPMIFQGQAGALFKTGNSISNIMARSILSGTGNCGNSFVTSERIATMYPGTEQYGSGFPPPARTSALAVGSHNSVPIVGFISHTGEFAQYAVGDKYISVYLCAGNSDCSLNSSWKKTENIDVSIATANWNKIYRIASQPVFANGKMFAVLQMNYTGSMMSNYIRPAMFSCTINSSLACTAPTITPFGVALGTDMTETYTYSMSSAIDSSASMTAYLLPDGADMHVVVTSGSYNKMFYGTCVISSSCASDFSLSVSFSDMSSAARSTNSRLMKIGSHLVLPAKLYGFPSIFYCVIGGNCNSTWSSAQPSTMSAPAAANLTTENHHHIAAMPLGGNTFVMAYTKDNAGTIEVSSWYCSFTSSPSECGASWTNVNPAVLTGGLSPKHVGTLQSENGPTDLILFQNDNSNSVVKLTWNSGAFRFEANASSEKVMNPEIGLTEAHSTIVSYIPTAAPTLTNHVWMGECEDLDFDCEFGNRYAAISGVTTQPAVSISSLPNVVPTWQGPIVITK